MFRPAMAPARPEHARILLIGAFALTGIVAFSWLARIPSIRASLDLSTPELGAVLLIGSIGSVVAVIASSALLARFGTTRVFTAGALINATGIAVMGIGPEVTSVWLFTLGIIISGVGGALLNVSANIESARIEQALGRTVIPHFHAAFSAGAVAGSLMGAGASWLGLPVATQFITVAAITCGLRLAAVRSGMVLPATADDRDPIRTRPRRSARDDLAVWAEPRTIMIGVVGFAAALSEGAANNWLAVAFVDGFGQPESVAALVLGVFIGSMTLVRVFGAHLIDSLGRSSALQLSGVFAIVGLAMFVTAGQPQVAMLGAACWGIGAGLCFPIAVAAASDDPARAAARVSVISSLGSIASLVGSPLIGFIAGGIGSQHALLAVMVALIASLAVSRHVQRPLSEVADPLEALAEIRSRL